VTAPSLPPAGTGNGLLLGPAPPAVRVALGGPGVRRTVVHTGDRLLPGRAPHPVGPTGPGRPPVLLPLPNCAPHTGALLGELVVGAEAVRLRWHGTVEAQLVSLFDAPGGARRVVLTEGMSAVLDGGESHLRVLRGRRAGPGGYGDLLLIVDVTGGALDRPARRHLSVPDVPAAAPPPALPPGTPPWYVALALAEPWLVGADDYPRPPTNREIWQRVLDWHGYAWNLAAPQRVDDAIRSIAELAFGGPREPYRGAGHNPMKNLRYAVGRRVAEVRLVTAADLAAVERAAAGRAAAGRAAAGTRHRSVSATAAAPSAGPAAGW
jgi:hypothetical protein